MLNKIRNLNYLLIFLVILISFIGAAGLYSAAGGSYSPWASRHLIRLLVFIFLAIVLALINIKFIYQFAYIFFILSLFFTTRNSCLCNRYIIFSLLLLRRGEEEIIIRIIYIFVF